MRDTITNLNPPIAAVITAMMPSYVASYMTVMPDSITMTVITNYNTQHCPKYHRTNPIISTTMATTRLCNSRDKQHCCGGAYD
jgi:hypothetical protein